MKRMLIAAAVAACIGANVGGAGTVTQRTYEIEYPRKFATQPPIAIDAGNLTLTQETPPEVKRLRDRVDQLEKEVARLKADLAHRPTITFGTQPFDSGTFNFTPSPLNIPLRKPAVPKMPEGTEERQFNGLPYYVVPLGQGARERSAPAEIVTPELLNPSK